jgi:DNA modification methylase
MRTNRTHLDQHEPPDRVHGGLLESVHLSGYTFDRACDKLKWLLRQDRWKAVSPGFDDVDDFLATIDFSEFRQVREQRKDIVRQLAAIKAGQRAIARTLGVDESTVRADLGKRRAGNPAPPSAESEQCPPEPERTRDIPAGNPASSLRPYYSEGDITIYHGDCREIVPDLPRGLMVTDPPYNMGYRYDEYDDAMDETEYWSWLHGVLRTPLVLIHYPERICTFARKCDRDPDKIVTWVYHTNTPRQSRAVAWFGITPDLSLDRQPYRNPRDKRIRARIDQGARLYDWWAIEQVKYGSAEKTQHPCQIPTTLMRRLLRVTPCDGAVIDPFCGSGTTLLVAQELGRPAIGIDSSEEYCEIAANRLRLSCANRGAA